jgi:hypothetical protein
MTSEQVRRLNRSKASERGLGDHLIQNDGPDPHLVPGGGIVSSRGRVGHITGLQFDVLSKTYAAENKQVVMPANLYRWWVQICQVAKGQSKQPLLRWEPSNENKPRDVQPMVIITQSRHADLLAYEKLYDTVQEAAKTTTNAVRAYPKEKQLAHSRKRKVRS